MNMKKYMLSILRRILRYAFFFFAPISLAHALDYVPIGEKSWSSVGVFSVALKNKSTGAKAGPFAFKAISLNKFKLEGPNRMLPDLDPKSEQSRKAFMDRLSRWVSGWHIVNYTFKYEALVGQRTHVRPEVKPPQQDPLQCKLEDFSLVFDREKCALVPQELLVSVTIEGIKNSFVVDVLKMLPSWSSNPVDFTDHTPHDEAVICVNKNGEIFKAAGHRRSCIIPEIPGISDFGQEHSETFAYYLPTPESHKGSAFAALIDLNQVQASTEEVWTAEVEGYDPEDNYSEDSSSSIYDDIGKGDLEEGACYKFYELSGTPEAIAAERNPFIYFAKNGRAYFTEAFQIKTYPVVQEAIDQTSPYLLQYVVPTKVECGYHNWNQPGWGLRWTILDADSLPVYPNACRSELLPASVMKIDLKKLIIEQHNNPAQVFYNLQTPDMQEAMKVANELPKVFVKNDAKIQIILSKVAEHWILPALDKLFVGAWIQDLDLSFSAEGNLPEFYKTISQMHTLKHLKIHSSDRYFRVYSGYQKIDKFPQGLISLEIDETQLVYSPSYMPTYTNTLGNVATALVVLPPLNLKKFVFRTIGSMHAEDARGSIPQLCNACPALEDLELKISFLDRRQWSDVKALIIYNGYNIHCLEKPGLKLNLH